MKLVANTRLAEVWRFLVSCVILACCVGCVPGTPSSTPETGYLLDQGVISRARFTVAVPDHWSGELVVIAHGSRPRKAPLSANLDPAGPFVASLLARGWMVATTSYRRNGIVLADGQEDLHRLLGAIVGKYGPCHRIIIEGSSMGANIGLLLAEQASLPDPHVRLAYAISGIVALGAAPAAEGEDGPISWTHAPRLPVLFVSNRSEIADVQKYAGQVRRDRNYPAVWILDRDGHVNINAPERLAAIMAMADWCDDGPAPTGDATTPFDITVDLSDRVSVAIPTEHLPQKQNPELAPLPGRLGRILAVDPIHGNLGTDLVAADLWALGLQPGDLLRLICGKVKREAKWAATYSDVAKGEFVVFLAADGTLKVAVNLGNAAQRLKCNQNEPLEITPWFDRGAGVRYH